ncbi:MAG: hypothetical protein Q7S22_00950 [Candidatus Micrarchaeota archaeon]|nr:hypothetical protein [Candidatus Micrarchaeota archaeon]
MRYDKRLFSDKSTSVITRKLRNPFIAGAMALFTLAGCGDTIHRNSFTKKRTDGGISSDENGEININAREYSFNQRINSQTSSDEIAGQYLSYACEDNILYRSLCIESTCKEPEIIERCEETQMCSAIQRTCVPREGDGSLDAGLETQDPRQSPDAGYPQPPTCSEEDKPSVTCLPSQEGTVTLTCQNGEWSVETDCHPIQLHNLDAGSNTQDAGHQTRDAGLETKNTAMDGGSGLDAGPDIRDAGMDGGIVTEHCETRSIQFICGNQSSSDWNWEYVATYYVPTGQTNTYQVHNSLNSGFCGSFDAPSPYGEELNHHPVSHPNENCYSNSYSKGPITWSTYTEATGYVYVSVPLTVYFLPRLLNHLNITINGESLVAPPYNDISIAFTTGQGIEERHATFPFQGELMCPSVQSVSFVDTVPSNWDARTIWLNPYTGYNDYQAAIYGITIDYCYNP